MKIQAADLHSGVFGGTIHEPMTDLFSVMSKLVDVNGQILVPGIYEKVRPISGKFYKKFVPIRYRCD